MLKNSIIEQSVLIFRDEAKNKLRENIQEFLENDESLERIPIDNEKQVLRYKFNSS